MADVLAQSAELKFEAYFVDGDTRTMTLKNPKGNITTSEKTVISAVGIRENRKPPRMWAENQCSRFRGRAWMPLHRRLWNRSPISA